MNRLAKSDPDQASRLLGKGRAVSVATDAAVRTAVGVSLCVSSGSSASFCFWDPCRTWSNHCGPFWNWWWSPRCSWWWSTCWSPWWGFGYYSRHWSFGFGGSWGSCYSSYPVCYAPYPVYYATVIYDTSCPAPVRETVYVESAPVAEQVPAVEGEGSIQVASEPQSGRRGGAQSAATLQLSLGDEAFREGRYSDSVHFYAKAVELEPDRGVLHLILSDALFATGDYHYAAYALRRALELDPTLADSVLDKHSFYGDPTEFDRQIDLLERYLEDHFLDEDARLLLAANYLFGAKPSLSADLLQSPSSVAVRDSAAGKILLERAKRVLREPPPPVDNPK